MRDIHEVIREKEAQMNTVERHIAVLKEAIRIMEDERQQAAQPQAKPLATTGSVPVKGFP